jgi:hypothetical protein
MSNNIKDIKRIIQRFQKKKSIEDLDFQDFLEEFGARLKGELLQYFKGNKNLELARYLLKKAIEERKKDVIIVFIEDLSLFSYILAQHQLQEDVLLIWQAKNADFDTWCGFDGDLLSFMGVQHTLDYLKDIKTKDALEAYDYVKEYKQVDVDDYFQRPHYYLKTQ